MAGEITNAQDAVVLIDAIRSGDWSSSQARLAEILLKLDGYYTSFTYIPRIQQGATVASVAADYQALDVRGFRVGPWVMIDAYCSLNKDLAAGAVVISLPPQLPAIPTATSLIELQIGTFTWTEQFTPTMYFGAAMMQPLTVDRFHGWAHNGTNYMGLNSPVRTALTTDHIGFSVMYRTSTQPF